MMIEKFKLFLSEVRSDDTLTGGTDGIVAFRQHVDKWFGEDDKAVSDPILARKLAWAIARATHVKAPSSRTVFFPVAEFHAVLLVTFRANPRTSTTRKFASRIDDAKKHAENRFEANHDQLTALLNGKGISDLIGGALRDSAQAHSAAQTGTALVERAVALLALDIDHFKQINDTRGHIYGDAVLQCLGRRLAMVASNLEEVIESPLSADVARPSGEEFLILIQGQFTSEESVRLAEHVRAQVADQPLPSDAEWKGLSKAIQAGLTLPPANERKITISIGVAAPSFVKLTGVADAGISLRNQADMALYSAKSSGRNRVHHFNDILQQYGRILEHHAETDVVGIDIGRQVNVAFGQEFRVFHPDFTGEKPFTHSDGRTTRSLGVYPRYTVGRIYVFDVQAEVSFCRVAEKSCLGRFPSGSRLEAIPLGSISHLVGTPSIGGAISIPSFTPSEQLEKILIDECEQSRKPIAIVFALDHEAALLNDRGTAFVNEALARLFESIRQTFADSLALGQTQKTEFTVIIPHAEEEAMQSKIRDVLDKTSGLCKGLASCSAGYYLEPAEESGKIDGDASNLDHRSSIKYAQFASADARRKGNQIVNFSAPTAHSVLQASRTRKQFAQTITDYREFRSLGVNYSWAENSAALAAFEMSGGDRELMIEAGSRAVEFMPNAPVLSANLGIYYFRFGERLKAHACFEQARAAATTGWNFPDAYLASVALATFAALEAGEFTDGQIVVSRLEDASSLVEKSAVRVNHFEIVKALYNAREYVAPDEAKVQS